MGGFRKRLGNRRRVPMVKVEDHVTRCSVMHKRRPGGSGGRGIGDGGQPVNIHEHRFGGILRLRCCFRHNNRNRIANEAHLISGQNGLARFRHIRSVPHFEGHAGWQVAHAGIDQVLAGQNSENTRHLFRGSRIDRPDDAMRGVGADHHRVGLAEEVEVVGITTFTAQQHRVFLAGNRLADGVSLFGELCQVHLSVHT